MIFKASLLLASLAAAAATGQGNGNGRGNGNGNGNGRGNGNGNRGGGSGGVTSTGGGASSSSSCNGGQCLTLTSVRSFNGAENPLSGNDAELLRIAGPAHYPDTFGIGTNMFTWPNARDISNIVAQAPAGVDLGKSRASDLLWQWGQFMDHDIGLTEGHDEPFWITSSTCNNGDSICNISMQRALHHFTNGVREQLNEITGFLDASMVYGHTSERASFLRDTGNGGRMKVSANNLLPLDNNSGLANALPGGLGFNAADLYIGGDIRVNEQIGLLAMHTLWVREHNRIAGLLAARFGRSNDEDLYQLARKIVTAEIQVITYNEFLPILIGSAAPSLASYGGFDPTCNPGVAQEFSTVAFRVGHTFLSENLIYHNGVTQTGSINLLDAFFTPGIVAANPELIDETLIGQSVQAANVADIFVIEEVRSLLFGAPISGEGRDLVAFNIQRGRDNGVVKYNDMRAGYLLPRKASFADVSSDPEVVRRLEEAYAEPDPLTGLTGVDACDPWICGLAEDAVNGGELGEMFSTIIGDQFQRFMDCDEFFFLNDPDTTASNLSSAGIDVQSITLADVINANTNAAAPIPHPAMLA